MNTTQQNSLSRTKGSSKLLAATAKQINEQHLLARSAAETAIEHAILCGQMLLDKKLQLSHGEFQPWIEKNCEFSYRSAARYMDAAQNPERALRAIQDPKPKAEKPPNKLSQDPPKSATTCHLSDETTTEKAPFLPPESTLGTPKGAAFKHPQKDKPEGGVSTVILGMPEDEQAEPERPDDIDEDAAIALAETDYAKRMAAVMEGDDKLAAAAAQIKQQSSLIAALEITRDGYMRGKEAVTQMLAAEQRKNTRLEKEVAKLRERIESMEGA